MTSPAGDFDCDAYGPAGRNLGALCFRAEPRKRVCEDLGECRRFMTAERQRVFQQIQERAAAGDETAVYLAGEFTDPGQLLCGRDQPERDRAC